MSQEQVGIPDPIDATVEPPKSYRVYGKFDYSETYLAWEGGKREVTVQEYVKLSDTYTKIGNDGQPFQANAKSIEFTFTVDQTGIRETTYPVESRRVILFSADWNQTVKKSFESVLGAGCMEKKDAKIRKTLNSLRGKYVWKEDRPQVKKNDGSHINAKTGEPFGVFHLVKVFVSREECVAAAGQRAQSANVTQVNIPPANGNLPASFVEGKFTMAEWLDAAANVAAAAAKIHELKREAFIALRAKSLQVTVEELKKAMDSIPA